MKIRIIVTGLLFSMFLLLLSADSFALTSEEMLRLKKAGISEEIIVLLRLSSMSSTARERLLQSRCSSTYPPSRAFF